MKYRLSKLIPVRMTSHYAWRRPDFPPTFPDWPERATWWQWRGRIWAHHRYADFAQRHRSEAVDWKKLGEGALAGVDRLIRQDDDRRRRGETP